MLFDFEGNDMFKGVTHCQINKKRRKKNDKNSLPLNLLLFNPLRQKCYTLILVLMEVLLYSF